MVAAACEIAGAVIVADSRFQALMRGPVLLMQAGLAGRGVGEQGQRLLLLGGRKRQQRGEVLHLVLCHGCGIGRPWRRSALGHSRAQAQGENGEQGDQ